MRGDSGYAYLPAGQAELEFSKYEARIKALEKQCATLAAEIDLMASVVTAAQHWHSLSKYRPDRYFDYEQDLANAVVAYQNTKEQQA